MMANGDRRMKTTVNGISVHYELAGPPQAPVVTMSHSLATNLAMFDPTAAALRTRFRVLRYDTRGHGQTDAPQGAYSLGQLAADARALLATLGIARTHWVGVSMGGMIGQTLALESSGLFASLALCDTASRIPDEARATWDDRVRIAETRGMEPLVEPTIARWFTEPFRATRPDVVEPVRAMIRATPTAGYAGCCHAIKPLDLTERLRAIAIPTLILVGEDDPGTPVAASRAMHERIGGSTLVILKSAAHLANLEQPDAFNRALLDFLESLP